MRFTVTFNLGKEEVLAVGRTLLPEIEEADILQSPTTIVNEWIKTTVVREVRRIMEKNNDR